MRRDAPPINTAADLNGRRLAVLKDSRAHEYARRQNWNLQYVDVHSLADAVDAVHDGRADVLLATKLVTLHQVQTLGYDNVVATPLQLPAFAYREHFGVQKGDAKLLAQLNEGLLAVYKDGTYNQLHERWVGPLEPRKISWRDLRPYLPLFLFLTAGTLGGFLWQRRLLRRLARQAAALGQSEERLRLVFEGSQDAFWDWDVTSGEVLRSPHWAGMLGYAPEEIGPGRAPFLSLLHPDDQVKTQAFENSVRAGQDQFAFELRMRAKSGEWKWILDRGKVVARDPVTGAPLRMTGTHTDITERKAREAEADKLQSKMQEAQKLESLGVLAGGIAHDFNNLLTVILGNSALARLESADSSVNAARLDSVVAAANRAAELCHQLLAYAGKGSYAVERINLNELVTETARLLELSISKQARLEFRLAPDLPKIGADRAQLRQVIMNLVINASEALDHKSGTIRIATTPVTLPLPASAATPPLSELVPGDYVCLEITDTGSGMTPEVLGRIFDPFFTTKFTGRGLGLPAVLGIVRTHGGALKVQSTSGQGSTFRVYLPVSSRHTDVPFPPVCNLPPAGA
jgi:PAS domain S-box-containing protein